MSTSRPSTGLGPALQRFIAAESSAGLVLTLAALLALVVANSAWGEGYRHVLEQSWRLGVGDWTLPALTLTAHGWINDGWMALFFFVVGLEIRREMAEGELATRAQALLPIAAAVGGMLLPALACFAINAGDEVARRAWAVPMATDIAFAIAVLTLLGRGVPSSLKVFLTALAIIDDLGAILVIALGYTARVDTTMLGIAAVLAAMLLGLNRARVSSLLPYAATGLLLWFAVWRSGIHPTVAGVLTALAVPVRDAAGGSPNERAQHGLHPWVAFVVLPVFAFANAGVALGDIGALFAGGAADAGIGAAALTLPLGIAIGLVAGKLVGVYGAAAGCVRAGWAAWPEGATRRQLAGVAALCGIGFTMSLFIGDLAVGAAAPALLTAVKLGVFGGSLVSIALGAWLLRGSGDAAAVSAPRASA